MNPRQTLTDEQKKDIDERTKLFEKDLTEIQEKHQLVIDSYPQYVPTNQGFTTISLVGIRDTKYTPVPSPLSGSIIKE